jgi:hypothetical protein
MSSSLSRSDIGSDTGVGVDGTNKTETPWQMRHSGGPHSDVFMVT